MDEQTTAFVESGSALIIGTVGDDGAPCAGRGWGLTVLDEPGALRLLLDGDDAATLARLEPGAPIAITAASVKTLQSMQFKGRVVRVEDATDDDVARGGRFCDAMFGDIHATDFTPLELLEHMRPVAYVPCVALVTDAFDQTPGPGAGARRGEQ